MADISALGLGSMGSALAAALQRGDHRLCVWNRTAATMERFVEGGAVGATSASAAIRSSPVVLVCVDDYRVTREILEGDGAGAELANRTLVQVSTGTPREAREAAAWVGRPRGSYIDGAILGGPGSIGTDQALLLFGGPGPAYRRCEPTLRCLGGQVRYLGENVVAPAALDLAWLCQRFGLFVGVAHGARICEAEGVGVDQYASMFPEGDRARLLARVIHAGVYDHPSATLSVWYNALQRVRAQARDAGIDSAVPDFVADLFERAIAQDHGQDESGADKVCH
jgi:3-hydroxyisobutyrate dehydrogenase-like beta-hydroxyacid dehydrogenase